MSWKSLLTAGLLCIIASPAMAAPRLKVTNGALDANGNWIWNVTIANTGATSPTAAEIGLAETFAGAQIVSVNRGDAFTGANTQNPGTSIYGWEDPGLNANGKPVGLNVNCTGCTIDTTGDAVGTEAGVVEAGGLDEIFAAMGSLLDVPNADTNYLQVITAGPIDTRLTTSVALRGAYTAAGATGGTNGRVSEITGGPNATNYNNFAGTAARTVVLGDINLSGVPAGPAAVTGADFGTLLVSLNKNLGARNWTHGDLNGTTNPAGAEVTGADFGLLLTCLNKTTPACSTTAISGIDILGAGAASGGSVLAGTSVVPEPASVALVVLGFVGLAGFVSRRRKN